MYTITKQFGFCASHRLAGLDPNHPCGRDHGHNYTVEVILAAEDLDGTGFVTDFRRLEPVRRYLDEHLDHRCLNDVVAIQPSAELLARHLYEWCRDNLDPMVAARLRQVRVSETPSTWATYAPEAEAGRS